MTLVATLIANPLSKNLSPELAEMARVAINANTIEWLAEGIACDIFLPQGCVRDHAEYMLRNLLRGQNTDLAIQEQDNRRKKALIADMDSTMIDQECIDELAAEVGLKEHVAAITARAMNGEMDFEQALEERVALLAGLEAGVTTRIIENRITPASGSRTLVQTMRVHGAYTALVSGGFTNFTRPIAEALGFHEHRANVLEEVEGRLTGTVLKPILGADAKVHALNEIAIDNSLTTDDFIAVGDGANDLPMLQLAGIGVALHAKPSVAEHARVIIDHGDLTSLLYLQGYKMAGFTNG